MDCTAPVPIFLAPSPHPYFRPLRPTRPTISPRAPPCLAACRKLELQAQAAAALAADNAWWQDDADAPANFVTARTPAEYKALIMGAAPTQLVVVDYLKPSCNACRRLSPKLKQIAASNPETLFIKVLRHGRQLASSR